MSSKSKKTSMISKDFTIGKLYSSYKQMRQSGEEQKAKGLKRAIKLITNIRSVDIDLSKISDNYKNVDDSEMYRFIRDFSSWEQVDDGKCKCKNCETVCFIAMYPSGANKNFCPNCGAKMNRW